MTDLNTVIVMGRLTRTLGEDERSFGYTNGGTARANFSIAVNRSVKKGDSWEDETSYFDVVLWGKQAESLKPYLTKGTQIVVQGALKQERWENKDGSKASRIIINAEDVRLCGGKTTTTQPVQSNNAPVPSVPANEEVFPEDIPFC